MFPPKFDHLEGLYSSYIMGNIIGEKNSDLLAFLRTNLKCDDNNMFVTNFVLSALLDIHEMGMLDIEEKDLALGFGALLKFRDKNRPEGLPLYNFWP